MERTKFYQLIKWAACILIPLGIYCLPVSGNFTIPMRSFLVATTFVILLAAFELLPNMLVGLLLPVAYVLTDTVPVGKALGVWSGSFMVFMIVGGMIFANALDECGLLKRIALWAGTKCQGNLIKLLFALMISGMLIMAVSFTNAWLVTIVLCYSVVKALDLINTKEGLLIMIVAQIVSTTALNFIYSPVTVALWGGGVAMVEKEFEMPWYVLTVYNLPLIIIQIFLTCLLFLYIILFPWHGWDMNYAFILIPMLCFLPGIDIATKQKSLDTVNFGFIIFIASCMGIGAVGAAVGIGPAMSEWLTPILGGLPIPIFLFLCIILGIIMNILMTPLAMQVMFPGPLASMGMGLGITYPLLPFMAMFFANDMVFFPYENAYLLVLFGFGALSTKEFLSYNLIKMAATLVLFWVLVLPYWYLIGLI